MSSDEYITWERRAKCQREDKQIGFLVFREDLEVVSALSGDNMYLRVLGGLGAAHGKKAMDCVDQVMKSLKATNGTHTHKEANDGK